eukprot:5815059-Amphidinium_carterae.1
MRLCMCHKGIVNGWFTGGTTHTPASTGFMTWMLENPGEKLSGVDNSNIWFSPGPRTASRQAAVWSNSCK